MAFHVRGRNGPASGLPVSAVNDDAQKEALMMGIYIFSIFLFTSDSVSSSLYYALSSREYLLLLFKLN